MQLATIANKVKATAYKASLMAGAAPLMLKNAMASEGDIGWITGNDITVDPSNLNGNDILNRVVTVMVGAFVLLGIVWTISGILAWIEADNEGNTTAQTKAVKKIITGILAILAPMVIKFILGNG